MYEKVLVAIDHSDASQHALAAARELARLSQGEAWVLHVREREVIPRMGLVPTESDAEAAEQVKAAAAALAEAGVTVHAELTDAVFGQAAQVIVETARQHEVGVIVMGSRGRSDLAGLILGSTAHKVIHLADRPVLVVRLTQPGHPAENSGNRRLPNAAVPSYSHRNVSS